MAKTIRASVGAGGVNRPADVFTVQYLLNLVPKNKGGPSPELAVDAICGPLTRAAILQFQRASGAPCDGRIDPNGPTFMKLIAFDPYPGQDLGPAMAGKVGKAGSAAQKAAAEAILRKIGEIIAKDQGKHLPPQGGVAAEAGKAMARAIDSATRAAAKVISEAAKQGGLPVGANPFGPAAGYKLGELVAKAIAAAQKAAEDMGEPARGIPVPAPLTAPARTAGKATAEAVRLIVDAAMKAAEAAAKWGKAAPAEPPQVKLPLGDVNAKLGQIIKDAADAVGKMVEGVAKAASKLS